MIKKRLKILKKKISNLNIDGYIIPKNDEFFSEYAFTDRLKIISDFTGSAGVAIILINKNYLFVDGRYTVQAEQQSGQNFSIVETHKFLPKEILKNLTLGIDPGVFTEKQLKPFVNKSIKIKLIKNNLVDEIYSHKRKKINQIFSISNKVAGESFNSKIQKVKSILKKNRSDYLFISAPENVAWILNIRGWDNPNSPIPNCRCVIGKKGKVFLITEKIKTKKIIKEKKLNLNQVIEPKNFENLINNLNGEKFLIDENTCSILNKSLISLKFRVKVIDDPCYKLKALKNQSEIKNMINAHIHDGVALTKFIFWMKKRNKKIITEIEAKKKLEKFRNLNKNYLRPSFQTISGTGSNAALPHYIVTKKSNKKIEKQDIFLCDSGGQYKYGTTDVTRTICFTKPRDKIKNIFTKVLKGHIAVATTDLKKDKTGKKIDLRARKYLKKDGLDYAHGTGHGVGFFSNVHEGPQAITKNNNFKIEEGMIVSNEPGYYKKNEFGIRIENLVYVKRFNKSLYFENLTLAPIDKDLINFDILNNEEKNYLFRYHLDVYSKISKFLEKPEKKWLSSLI
jgi:Xaa-Pro aminopeptidase